MLFELTFPVRSNKFPISVRRVIAALDTPLRKRAELGKTDSRIRQDICHTADALSSESFQPSFSRVEEVG